MDLDRVVGLERPSLRRADIESATGVPPGTSVRWWRAMGFPEVGDDAIAFNRLDLDLVERIGELEALGLVDDDDVARVARLLGASCQRIAEAQIALLDEMIDRMGSHDGIAHRDQLTALVASDDAALIDLMERSVVYVWRRHMLAALGRRLDPSQDLDHETDVRAVGFADLSGFTRFSKKLTAEELTRVIDAFEDTAFEVVAGTDSRVVKLIGDEVMWVSPTLASGVRVALDLRERLADVELDLGSAVEMPDIHCGVAVGPTVVVAGDVFGTTVNLASRLTSVARKGTVVVPRADAGLLDAADDLVVRPARRNYALRGIGDVRIAVVDRNPEPAITADPAAPES